uniref:Uncharacterized protein n=1 Tax=Siphoviridae sp. ctWuM9 TaxID=2826364 RepID=A0A8S5MER5_9CAUD|nr:MAG TPA: hypothetical protein [Siphoviridae sp. ctWuM9]
MTTSIEKSNICYLFERFCYLFVTFLDEMLPFWNSFVPPLLHRAALKKFPAGVFRKNTFICCGLGMKPTPPTPSASRCSQKIPRRGFSEKHFHMLWTWDETNTSPKLNLVRSVSFQA